MKARILFPLGYITPVVGLLVLTVVFSHARPALGQTEEACPLPPGVTPPANPTVTAQQVEDGSASLMDFALALKNHPELSEVSGSLHRMLHLGCLYRQEGGPYRSGSTYLVQLTPDGRLSAHAKNMSLSGRLLNPSIYGAILQALGINPADLTDRAAALAAFSAALAGDGGPFNVPDIPGASGYAAAITSPSFQTPIVLLAGFDLNESHVVDEVIDYGDPTVTARDVVDRETLTAFVTQAGERFREISQSGDPAAFYKARNAMRDENGPWRHGSVYLYILDLTSNIITFHGAFPDRFELRPLIATVRDAVTGELILPQVIEAAKSNPEGGFVEYYFDDPTDETDSADIPKVGYAREFTGELSLGGRAVPLHFIIGSGFYGSEPEAPEVVTEGPRTEVEVTVLGDAVEGLTVEFSRAIAGRSRHFAWNATTDADGQASLTISGGRQVSGFYQARARNADGKVVGQWHSIPLNRNRRQVLELTLGGGMRIAGVESLAAAKAVASASRLGPNVPNPFNSTTLITYHLAEAAPVRLVVYNTLGQVVATLVDAYQETGVYHAAWDGRDASGVPVVSGVYLYRLQAGAFDEVRKMTVLQ